MLVAFGRASFADGGTELIQRSVSAESRAMDTSCERGDAGLRPCWAITAPGVFARSANCGLGARPAFNPRPRMLLTNGLTPYLGTGASVRQSIRQFRFLRARIWSIK